MPNFFSKIFRRGTKAAPGPAFKDMSREDQVAYLENQRGTEGHAGARDSAKAAPQHPWAGNNGPGS